MKMVWEAPEDDWEEYIHTHMEAIRAKYFPKNAQAKVRRAPFVLFISPTNIQQPPHQHRHCSMHGTDFVQKTFASLCSSCGEVFWTINTAA